MREPTFSICIPNYNYGHYIGETIQSVLDQSYQNFEIVVADNCSTDNSVEVVESFRSDKIKLIRNRYNIGFAPNLQRVTMYARNDYMILLSSDDLMKPRALEEYARVLVEQGPDAQRTVIMSEADVIDQDGKAMYTLSKARDSFASDDIPVRPIQGISVPGAPYEVFRGRDVLRDALERLATAGIFCTTMYPRALYDAVEGYNSVRTVSPDMHFLHKLLSLDPLVVYVRRPLFAWRLHAANQAAIERRQAAIKHEIDYYLYTLDYTEAFLKEFGLTKRDLVRVFIDRDCLRNPLSLLARGSYVPAFKRFAFGFATYPGEMLRNPKILAIVPLLMLGPLARIVAYPMYRLYRRVARSGTGAQRRRDA